MNLTVEQKKFIEENFHKIPDLIELTRATFKDGTIDGRSKQGRAVRAYLASKDMKYKTTKKKRSHTHCTQRGTETIHRTVCPRWHV